MAWRTTGDVAEFLDAAGAYLRQERARNTVLLTVTAQLLANQERDARPAGNEPRGTGPADAGPADASPADAGPADPGGPPLPPLFGWWQDNGGAVGGAFMHTPPRPLLLSAVTAGAAADLAAALAGRPLRGVNAYPEAAARFAAAWHDATGSVATPHSRLRLYRLGELAWPDPAPAGAARVAADADALLLATWFAAFGAETGALDAADHAAAVRDRLDYGGITVWQAGGRLVSMAGVSRPAAGMVRVGPVYTPREFRGHGYGSAVTAALSLRVREAGAAEVVLYTDLDNPISNSIYQRIGYRAVEDRVDLAFSAPAAVGR